MQLMHPPTKCINHFILFSLDVLDVEVVFTEKFQPSSLFGIPYLLFKQVFQTAMIYLKLEFFVHEIMSPHF
jgi:hypothetical protein